MQEMKARAMSQRSMQALNHQFRHWPTGISRYKRSMSNSFFIIRCIACTGRHQLALESMTMSEYQDRVASYL
jgi:hypothetical protein